VDEDASGSSTSLRPPASEQLRGQVRGGAREGGACLPCGRAEQSS